MESNNLPEGYQTVMPYLILDTAEKFLEFTQKAFGATEKMKHLDDANRIMHAEIQIGGSTIMFANSTSDFSVQTSGLYINVEDADLTYKKALEEGASSIMAPRDQDYGRSGGVVDPTGNTWWITSPVKEKA